jgi:multicomponent Na+:H+ antiporter subunit G
MDLMAILLLICGLFFFTGGAVGIIRFPDFYTRLHPAGKLDTAGQLMTLSAAALFVLEDITRGDLLTAAKIILIVIFVYLTSPTATHAIVDAGVRAGLKPWEKAQTEETGGEE